MNKKSLFCLFGWYSVSVYRRLIKRLYHANRKPLGFIKIIDMFEGVNLSITQQIWMDWMNFLRNIPIKTS